MHSFPCFDQFHGIVTKHLFPDFTCSRPMLVFEIAKQVELSIRWVVKGYYECPFEVNIQVVCVSSGLSVVECLVYATLEAHYIFLLIIILLSSHSVAQVNVPGVCFFAILRRHTHYLFY